MKVVDMITALVASLDERPMFQSLIAISGHKRQTWRSAIALCCNGRGVDVEL
ncbi:hypothetical protein ACVWZM_004616 [Bradyrhizobium sp. USDA 4501]